jgi:polysaccharide deacetylase 2 family uncharacterized protein YibQ
MPSLEMGIVAVIIDDVGHNRRAAMPFIEMEQPVALSVMPGRPAALSLARDGFAAGKTIMLHLPMEPSDPAVSPGEGAILIGQEPEKIRRTLDRNLDLVPNVAGINNHMGSLATTDRRIMAEVLKYIEQKDLFFVDSLTSPGTVGYQMARDRKIPTALRDVFLDNDRDPEAIDRMVGRLLDTAEKRGWALGIGHPYPETAAALERMSEEARSRNIRWVTIEELLRQLSAEGS